MTSGGGYIVLVRFTGAEVANQSAVAIATRSCLEWLIDGTRYALTGVINGSKILVLRIFSSELI